MKRKKLLYLLGVLALICTAIAAYRPAPGINVLHAFAFPFTQLGDILRALSLSGNFGNTIAVIIYAMIGFSPLLILWQRSRKRKIVLEDSLLAITSAMLFYFLYLMINPSYMMNLFSQSPSDIIYYGKAQLGGIFYSVLIGYLVLKLIRRISKSETSAMLGMLKYILSGIVVLLVFSIFYLGTGSIIADYHALLNTNIDSYVSHMPTKIFIFIRFVITHTPLLLTALIYLSAIDLINAISADRYNEDIIPAAQKVVKLSKITVAFTVISSMVFNILQLLFAKALLTVNISTNLPIIAIVLVLVMLLLATYFTESKRLYQDNQMFV